jgi:hypothetical protein
MAQQTDKDMDMPNRSSNMEPAEGSRETVRNSGDQGGGISNRSLDEELSRQQDLPPRGRSRSESESEFESGSDPTSSER